MKSLIFQILGGPVAARGSNLKYAHYAFTEQGVERIGFEKDSG